MTFNDLKVGATFRFTEKPGLWMKESVKSYSARYAPICEFIMEPSDLELEVLEIHEPPPKPKNDDRRMAHIFRRGYRPTADTANDSQWDDD
jgi:hypothetical protein